MPNEVKLLPCPFCGAEPQRLHQMDGELSDAFWHPEAECILSMCGLHRDKWLGWNTRPTTVVAGERQSVGVPPSGSGHSAEPEPSCTVSAVPVSVPNAALLAEKDRLDRVSLEQSFTTDPVERLVGDALTVAGFEWRHEGHPARRDDPITLDFEIVGGPHVEVKRFHTPRVEGQLAQAENVILLQGIGAARWFASAIEARRAATAETGAVHESATAASGDAQ